MEKLQVSAIFMPHIHIYILLILFNFKKNHDKVGKA